MSDRLTSPGVRVTVQRHVTEEETICFGGFFETTELAEAAASTQLALCRAHMAKFNEDVRLVDAKKSAELDAEIESKGAEVKRLTADLAELRMAIAKGSKRVDSNVRAAG